jgi:hypothetical protein
MKSCLKPVQPLGRRTVVAASAAMLLSAWVNPLLAQSGRKARVTLNSVLLFDETTWARLVNKGPRPAVYIFTTTDRPENKDVFEKLLAFILHARRPVELVMVLMDVQGKGALEHAPHFVGATRLYTFNGSAPAICQSVDPKWSGATPYIVLLGHDGSIQRSTGMPEEVALKKWLP